MNMMSARQVENIPLKQYLKQDTGTIFPSCVAGSCIKTKSFDLILNSSTILIKFFIVLVLYNLFQNVVLIYLFLLIVLNIKFMVRYLK